MVDEGGKKRADVDDSPPFATEAEKEGGGPMDVVPADRLGLWNGLQ